MGKRIRFQDIRAGKTAYMVTVGEINKITFTSVPYLENGNWKCNYKYLDDTLRFDSHLSDNGVYTRNGKYTPSYINTTNAMFSNLNAAKRWVEETKEIVSKYKAEFSEFSEFSEEFCDISDW